MAVTVSEKYGGAARTRSGKKEMVAAFITLFCRNASERSLIRKLILGA